MTKSNWSICIKRQGDFLELSCIHKGLKVSKVYNGYTLGEATILFKEYLEEGLNGLTTN